jgi:hypothetical protein
MEYRHKLYVSSYLHAKLKLYCQQRDKRMVNVTERAISLYLKEIETQK